MTVADRAFRAALAALSLFALTSITITAGVAGIAGTAGSARAAPAREADAIARVTQELDGALEEVRAAEAACRRGVEKDLKALRGDFLDPKIRKHRLALIDARRDLKSVMRLADEHCAASVRKRLDRALEELYVALEQADPNREGRPPEGDADTEKSDSGKSDTAKTETAKTETAKNEGTKAEDEALVQLASDGTHLFALRRDGKILVDEGKGFRVFDGSTGTVQIAADKGVCYALKSSGALWRRAVGTPWKKIDDQTGARQLIAAGGSLYLLKANGHVFSHDGTKWQQLDAAAGTRSISVDGDGNVYLLKSSGNIFRRLENGSWSLIDDGTTAQKLEAGGGALYVLRKNGHIWRRAASPDGAPWLRIDDGTGTIQLESDGDRLYALKSNGAVWQWKAPGWHNVRPAGPKLTAIEAAGGRLWGIDSDGKLVPINLGG